MTSQVDRLPNPGVPDSEEDWSTFVAAHRDGIARFAGRFLARRGVRSPPAATEEILQEVLLRLVDRGQELLRRYDPAQSSLEGYLAGITRRVCLEWGHRAGHGMGAPLPAAVEDPSAEDPLRTLLSREGDERVRAAVACLPPRDRLLVALRFEEGLPFREIARVLGVAEGTVSPLLRRAYRRLARRLPAEPDRISP
ncbi:MAG: sigma-70 family RNA polymerase sigma factor [Planctomycetes bacterium]|nr:sigma-70 family RNA polymerase sigma factor [Planctomycetota bacterium]